MIEAYGAALGLHIPMDRAQRVRPTCPGDVTEVAEGIGAPPGLRGCSHGPATSEALQANDFRQPHQGAGGHILTLPPHLAPELADAKAAEVTVEDLRDPDQPHRWSSSTWTKTPLSCLRLPMAWSSRRLALSSASIVQPPRSDRQPLSPHPPRPGDPVLQPCAELPNLTAIDPAAARLNACSRRCERTIPTAGSQNWTEYGACPLLLLHNSTVSKYDAANRPGTLDA